MARNRPRTLVTATPPTPNGDLHLGHLSGPYLAGDVIARYQEMRSGRADYVSGSDDHQSYVPLRGRREKTSPEQVASEFGEKIQETLRSASIELDSFVLSSRSSEHAAAVKEVFLHLLNNGTLVRREGLAPYCERTGRYLFEAYIRGHCPHCGATADGNICEECGRPNDCADLLDPVCKLCGEPPTLRPSKRLHIPLSRFAGPLERFWSTVEMPPHLRALCETMLAEGLPDIAATHPTSWGLPAPVDDLPDQRVYVWFEMAPGYLAEAAEARGATGRSLDDMLLAWNSYDDIVQCFGFDNGYFHAVLFPAIFLALDRGIKLPGEFIVNEFYRLDGAKFSTSRKHAIWVRDFLRTEPVDAVRYFLCWDRPSVEQNDFTFDAYRSVKEGLLLKTWQGWLDELSERMLAEFEGHAPEVRELTSDQRVFVQTLLELAHSVGRDLEARRFAPDRAARELHEFVRSCRVFGAAHDHLVGIEALHGMLASARAIELAAARTLACIAYPIMPHFSRRLWASLGLEGSPLDAGWPDKFRFLEAGARVGFLNQPYFAGSG